jgi:soluble lytic murein transglycosylase-like protein
MGLAKKIAIEHRLDPSLVCAVIEQESGWNPWALRFEPIFEHRYIRPALPMAPTTEELCLAISWGLMQVMGETAREHGFNAKFLNALCDPATGLSVGCGVLSNKLTKAKGDPLPP